MNNKYRKTKYACYTTNLAMSIVASLSPLLFLTFRSLYGISFSMLGALVFINFGTQLAVDLVFSFYSHRFNIEKAVKLTPVLTAVGLFIYAVFPFVFPNNVYTGLVIGTVIFASSGGLAEVLISPVIAEIPSENPEREMSKLHSVYAWGVVAVVIVSTAFLTLAGKENWQWLALLWMLIPLSSCILFLTSDVPKLKTPEKASNVLSLIKKKEFLTCVFCIFFGSASENIMSQWCSSYLEQALHIPKLWGDLAGVALFFLMLGIGRSLHAKFGKNIYKVLIAGSAGAVLCYLVASASSIAVLGLIACAVTGLCTAMLWPGSLIIASDRFPSSGVAVFALMASGGDLGAAIAPQLVGTITDFAIKNEYFIALAGNFNITADQLGMKIGLFSASVFPLLATVLFVTAFKQHKKAVRSSL